MTMTTVHRDAFDGRCRRFVEARLGPSMVRVPDGSSHEEHVTSGSLSGKHLSVSEIFLPNGRPRGPSDFLALFIMQIAGDERSPGTRAQVKCQTPAALRVLTKESPAGLTISDVPIAAYSRSIESISVLVYRITRNARSERVVANLQSLVDAQDATRDDLYSSSLAQAVLDRLEVLEENHDAEIVVCGKTDGLDSAAQVAGSRYWVFFGGRDAGPTHLPLWVRNQQLYAGASLETAVPVSQEAYALVRLGHKADTASVRRYIDELRRKHALRREEFATSQSETYRAYVAKQTERRTRSNIEALYGHHRILTLVTPVAIEVSVGIEDLVMVGTDPETEFQRLVNELRDEFATKYGVRLPGVRVRSNAEDMPPLTYLFMINEIPLVMGTVERDKVFCNATDEQMIALNISGTRKTNPDDGSSGAWVAASSRAALEAEGITVWSPSQYIALHLKAVLRSNLREFLGVQDVVEAFTREAAAEDATLQRLRSEPGGLVRFRGVLTPLLDEKLACAPMPVLAKRYLEIAGLPSYEIAEHLRSVEPVLSSLTRDAARWKVYTLAPDFVKVIREHIVRQGDAAVLALEPEPTQEALSAVRGTIGSDVSDRDIPVIVVDDWQIRPFVKKLIELEFPNVMVVAKRETLAVEARVLEPVSVIDLE